MSAIWSAAVAKQTNSLCDLARSATGRRDLVVLDHAYHGNTTSLIDISPYKFDGPGGAGKPAHVEIVRLPSVTREQKRRRTGRGIEHAIEAMSQQGRPPAALFAETIPGCGGQRVLPDDFLPSLYNSVRAAGGLCIADEVQTGLGRMGDCWWAFETQGLVPDIVTIGKPIGNGHPLAAVVTSSEIAARFDSGMEYFNTFGGNPVSSAAGLAVLDVIEDEDLRGNASRVGALFENGLKELAADYACIADVRGRGLFLGVEIAGDSTKGKCRTDKSHRRGHARAWAYCSASTDRNTTSSRSSHRWWWTHTMWTFSCLPCVRFWLARDSLAETGFIAGPSSVQRRTQCSTGERCFLLQQ